MAGRGKEPVTVKDVLDAVDGMAPFSTQEDWDNSGLLAGSPNARVTKVLCCLDPTLGAIDEAERLGCEVIVTHHPILFHARKNLREDDPEGAVLCRLVRSGRALIAAHTNFDKAVGGVSWTLAEKIGLQNVGLLEGGLAMGEWRGSFGSMCENVENSLGCVVRPYANARREISSVAVCGGSAGSMWKIAKDAGADCFVTGEIHHNDALDMVAWGLLGIEAGHYHTEKPSIKALKMGLQKRFNELQYEVMVFESDYEPF